MKKVLVFLICSIASAAINVRDFGAGQGGDDTAAVQQALDTVSLTNGGTVLFPCGTYLVNASKPLTPRSYTVLQGESLNCSVIKNTNAGGGSLFNIVYDATHGAKIRFEHLLLLGRNQPKTACLSVGGNGNPKAQHVKLVDVKLTQCDPGILVLDAWDVNLVDSFVEFNLGNGVTMNAPNAVTGFYIYGSRIGSNGGYGIQNIGAVLYQLELSQSEVSYNGNTEISMGISRDSAIRDTWLEESDHPQNGVDVTGCIRCTIDGVHSDHALNGVFSSKPVDEITVSNSSFTNAKLSILLPPTSSNLAVFQNRGDTGISIGATSAYFGNNWPK